MAMNRRKKLVHRPGRMLVGRGRFARAVVIPPLITAAWLQKKMGACELQVEQIRRLFPAGVPFNAGGLTHAVEKIEAYNANEIQDDWVSFTWFAARILPKDSPSMGAIPLAAGVELSLNRCYLIRILVFHQLG